MQPHLIAVIESSIQAADPQETGFIDGPYPLRRRVCEGCRGAVFWWRGGAQYCSACEAPDPGAAVVSYEDVVEACEVWTTAIPQFGAVIIAETNTRRVRVHATRAVIIHEVETAEDPALGVFLRDALTAELRATWRGLEEAIAADDRARSSRCNPNVVDNQ